MLEECVICWGRVVKESIGLEVKAISGGLRPAEESAEDTLDATIQMDYSISFGELMDKKQKTWTGSEVWH